MRYISLVLFLLSLVPSAAFSESGWDFLHRQQSMCRSQGGDWEGMGCAPGGRPATAEERREFNEMARQFVDSLSRSTDDCLLHIYATDKTEEVGIVAERWFQRFGVHSRVRGAASLPNDEIIVFRTSRTAHSFEDGYLISNDFIGWKDRNRIHRARVPGWPGNCYTKKYAMEKFTPIFAGRLVDDPNSWDIEWLVDGEFGEILRNSSFLSGSEIMPEDEVFNYYTTVKVSLFTVEELELLRSEIYARNGLIFRTKRLREYFEAKEWYEPRLETLGAVSERDQAILNSVWTFEHVHYQNECFKIAKGKDRQNCWFTTREVKKEITKCTQNGYSFRSCVREYY